MRLDPARLHPVDAPGTHGDLRAWPDVDLPGLGRRADLYAWLPPDVGPGERFPVVYLHDGHNLFLPERSFAGAVWHADRAMETLAAQGIRAILVGIPCHPDQRGEEYSPYRHPELGGGRGEAYATFLADHLKPAVDAALPTLPGREHTVTAGSSLGGVISAHLWASRPEVFGGAGLFSPAFWWPGEQAVLDVEAALPAHAARPGSRVYLDTGGHEEPWRPEHERAYVEDAERLLRSTRGAGVPVRYVYDHSAYHDEPFWAERLTSALGWLLSGYAAPAPAWVDEANA